REIIQTYLSYVRPSTPALGDFRGAGHGSQFNRDQRAVGYGRSAMLFHELRQRVGEAAFFRAVQQIYAGFKGKQASWDDIRELFEAEAETDLQRFFSQRLNRTELPELGVENIRLDQGPAEARLTFTIVQKQQGPFELLVPIRIESISGVREQREHIDSTTTEVTVTLDSLATAIVLDAEFDLMRQPSRAETIPTWSQIMGAEACLVVLADEQQREKFQPFLDLADEYSWQVALSSELSAADLMGKTLVFLGTSGQHSRALFAIPDHSKRGFTIDVRVNPLDPLNRVALVSSENLQETQAAIGRLSHYGKYSFLHFNGGRAVEKSIAAAESGIRVELQERPSGIAVAALTDFDRLIDELLDYRVIYVGETHTSRADHLLQQMVIEALHTRLKDKGIGLAIGMEMFPASSQAALDQYIDDPTVEEAQFLKESRYYDVWRYDYRLFRPIFSFARKHRIPVIGLNLEREVVSSVFQAGGTKNLSDAQRQDLPADRQLDLPGYVERLTATHSMHQSESHGSGDLVGFIEAQALWDETMAATVVSYLQEHPNAAMVVLAGSQHTRKDSGIPPRVARRFEVKQASLVNLATSPLSGTELLETADYLFLLEAQDFTPQGKIGIVLEEKPYRNGTRMEIVGLTPQSNAEVSGLKEGDFLISIEGQQIETMVDVQAAMLDRLAGETISLVIRRIDDGKENDEQISIELFNPNNPHMFKPHP
ncbi:MAG: ChaN family lipoprotein, partial [Desulfocapsaceae bacterium]